MSSPIAQNLAISRRSDEVVKVYRERLQQIFMECRRVLKKKGICVFTYHHKLATAWDALGTAFLHSGLIVTKVLPMRGEGQGGLHTFDGTIKWDAVLVCRKGKAVKKKRSRPLISKKSTKQAFQEAADYFDTLSINKRIGFKEPDFTNLARALVISKSFIGTENSTTQSMSDTLKNIPVPGIFNGQT